MTVQREPEAQLDALRRRLYLPDATEEDLRHYLAERAALEPAATPELQPAPPRPRRRRSRIAIAGAALLVIAGVVATAVLHPWRPAAQVLAVDVGDGRVLPVVPGSASTPAPIAVSIDGLAVSGRRFTGHGNAVVDFTAPPGSAESGRALVVLTTPTPATARWRAIRLVHRANGKPFAISLARGATERGSTMATPTSFIYPSGPPDEVSVEAARGVHWTLVVAVTSDLGTLPH